MNKIRFLIICLIVPYKIFSQADTCGTIVKADQINFESGFTLTETNLIQLNKTISLTIHVVLNEEGLPLLEDEYFDIPLNVLNQMYSPIGLDFKVINTQNIPNYNFNILDSTEAIEYLVSSHYTANSINIYFVNEIYLPDEQEVAAISTFPSDNRDYIIFKKSAFNSYQLVHHIGHIFNLYHTHEKAFGAELVNESNCISAGDLCCDTPADPSLAQSVNEFDCAYFRTYKDLNDQFYAPVTQNYMAYTYNKCACKLTEDQYLRVINLILNYKNDIW